MDEEKSQIKIDLSVTNSTISSQLNVIQYN
jgi:hypothetical protein